MSATVEIYILFQGHLRKAHPGGAGGLTAAKRRIHEGVQKVCQYDGLLEADWPTLELVDL